MSTTRSLTKFVTRQDILAFAHLHGGDLPGADTVAWLCESLDITDDDLNPAHWTNLTNPQINAMLATLNYQDRDSQKADNYSNAGTDELAAQGWTPSLITRTFIELTDLGLASYDDGSDQLSLTDLGIDTIFDYLDAQKEA